MEGYNINTYINTLKINRAVPIYFGQNKSLPPLKTFEQM